VEIASGVDRVIEAAVFGSALDSDSSRDFDLIAFIEDMGCIPRISTCARTTMIYHAHDIFLFKERAPPEDLLEKCMPNKFCRCWTEKCGSIKYHKQIRGFFFAEEKAFRTRPITA